jgi:CheY-like chemotaxis protein
VKRRARERPKTATASHEGGVCLGVPMHLLVIEDDPVVGPLLVDAFTDTGQTATLVPSGEEALRQIATQRPDAVFLDIRLPTMNGIEVLRRIRAMDETLPVIVITGFATDRQINEARELGALDVVLKSEILNQIEPALDRLRRRRF